MIIILISTNCSSSTNQLTRSQNTILWIDRHFRRYQNSEVLSYLLSVTKRLESAAQMKTLGIEPDRLNTSWKIHIFESSIPNAFSVGTGNLIITKSLIQACENEAELASILAHEMSHYYLAHTEQNSSYSIEREIEADTLGLSLLELSDNQLQASISALSISYRQESENISAEKQENLNLRRENLANLIKRKNGWGFANDREFNRIKKSLR